MVSASAAVIATMTGMWAGAEGLGTPDKPVEVRMIANEAFANQWQTLMVPEFNKHYPKSR